MKKKKRKMPFSSVGHVNVVKTVAIGLNKAGVLNRYLELGIRKGPCFNEVASFAKEAYAVDIEDCKKFIKNNKNLIWFQGKSSDFLKKHNKNKKFDLVFIDADHSHKSSLSDFQLLLSLVNDNGLVLFHDTYPPTEIFTAKKYCNDTYKTAEYIRKNYPQYEFITLPFYYGVSIFRKLDRQLLWKQ